MLCNAGEDEKRLEACPTCRKMVCADCATPYHGKPFCSDGCGQWFFHGEGDDEEKPDIDFEE